MIRSADTDRSRDRLLATGQEVVGGLGVVGRLIDRQPAPAKRAEAGRPGDGGQVEFGPVADRPEGRETSRSSVDAATHAFAPTAVVPTEEGRR